MELQAWKIWRAERPSTEIRSPGETQAGREGKIDSSWNTLNGRRPSVDHMGVPGRHLAGQARRLGAPIVGSPSLPGSRPSAFPGTHSNRPRGARVPRDSWGGEPLPGLPAAAHAQTCVSPSQVPGLGRSRRKNPVQKTTDCNPLFPGRQESSLTPKPEEARRWPFKEISF